MLHTKVRKNKEWNSFNKELKKNDSIMKVLKNVNFLIVFIIFSLYIWVHICMQVNVPCIYEYVWYLIFLFLHLNLTIVCHFSDPYFSACKRVTFPPLLLDLLTLKSMFNLHLTGQYLTIRVHKKLWLIKTKLTTNIYAFTYNENKILVLL